MDEYNLTKREQEIYSCLRLGYTSKTIAGLLHISEETVRTHRANMMKKTRSINVVDMIIKLSRIYDKNTPPVCHFE